MTAAPARFFPSTSLLRRGPGAKPACLVAEPWPATDLHPQVPPFGGCLSTRPRNTIEGDRHRRAPVASRSRQGEDVT